MTSLKQVNHDLIRLTIVIEGVFPMSSPKSSYNRSQQLSSYTHFSVLPPCREESPTALCLLSISYISSEPTYPIRKTITYNTTCRWPVFICINFRLFRLLLYSFQCIVFILCLKLYFTFIISFFLIWVSIIIHYKLIVIIIIQMYCDYVVSIFYIYNLR